MNTFGRTEKTFGGGVPVWKRVDTILGGGATVDISSLEVGEIIPAGSMIAVADKVGTIVKSTETEAFASVVGLTRNDIVKEEGKNIGTATIVVEGVAIAERIDVPAEVQKALTRITFE